MKILGMEIRPLPKVVSQAADELWVTKDGRRMTIGEMDESHAKHALALIMRNVRAGKFMTVNRGGTIAFFRLQTIRRAVLQLEAERKFVEEARLSDEDHWAIMNEIDPVGQG